MARYGTNSRECSTIYFEAFQNDLSLAGIGIQRARKYHQIALIGAKIPGRDGVQDVGTRKNPCFSWKFGSARPSLWPGTLLLPESHTFPPSDTDVNFARSPGPHSRKNPVFPKSSDLSDPHSRKNPVSPKSSDLSDPHSRKNPVSPKSSGLTDPHFTQKVLVERHKQGVVGGQTEPVLGFVLERRPYRARIRGVAGCGNVGVLGGLNEAGCGGWKGIGGGPGFF